MTFYGSGIYFQIDPRKLEREKICLYFHRIGTLLSNAQTKSTFYQNVFVEPAKETKGYHTQVEREKDTHDIYGR